MKWIKKPVIANMLLVIISVTITFFVVEVGLRLTKFRSLLPLPAMPQYYYQADREIGYDLTPNFATSTHAFADISYSIWTNELGCFDMPYDGSSPYIYLTGDSFTWGFTPFEQKWGSVLQNFIGVRTLKCGVSGYGTKQELIKTKRALEKLPTPKLVVLGYFGGNDPEDDYSFPNKLVYGGNLVKKLEDRTLDYDAMEKKLPQIAMWSEKYCMITPPANPSLQRVKCFLMRHSIVYNLIKNNAKNLISLDALRGVGIVNAPVPAAPMVQNDYQKHLQNVQAFDVFARSKNTKLLVVLVPLGGDVYSKEVTDPYKEIKAFMDARNIAYVDLLSDFRVAAQKSSNLYWKIDPHWTPEGNRLAGLLVSRWVLEHSSWEVNSKEKLSSVNQELQSSYSITNK